MKFSSKSFAIQPGIKTKVLFILPSIIMFGTRFYSGNLENQILFI